jgi:hypothetical protein
VFIDYMTERIRESDQQGLTLLIAAEHLHVAADHAPAARKIDAGIRFLDGGRAVLPGRKHNEFAGEPSGHGACAAR